MIPVLAAVWAILTQGSLSSWVVGLPAVLFCVLAVRALPSEGSWHWVPLGAVTFVLFFVCQSFLSGLQVARLALRPRILLSPTLLYYDIRLPSSPARVFFANSVSLLPGTLSCILTDELLVVHVLTAHPSVEPSLHALEQRVAHLFDVTLRTGEIENHA